MSSRGPYAKGVAKREEILAVALEVVASNGCRKASNREIASRVGLSQAGLMHYFGSREHLYVEVLRARDERDLKQFWSPDAGVEAYFAVIVHNAEVPGLVQLYVEYSAEATISSHPAHDFFVRRNEWVRGLLVEAIEREQQAGKAGPNIDAPLAADLLIAAADGLQARWLLDKSFDMVVRLRELWRGVCLSSWQ